MEWKIIDFVGKQPMENIGDQLHTKRFTELEDNSIAQAATVGLPLPENVRFVSMLCRQGQEW